MIAAHRIQYQSLIRFQYIACQSSVVHGELQALGCPIEVPPTDFFYGMREMSVRDPDGNRITFGQEASS